MRTALISLMLTCVAIALDARAAEKAAAHAAESSSVRPLIERTFIVAPRKIGDFSLDDVYYDAANRLSGARFRYSLPGHQETRFDVFVYPAGRMPRAAAIEASMASFKAGIDGAREAGYYRDVEFLGEDDFPLDATKPTTADSPAEGSKEARLVAIINAASPLGRRLQMNYLQLPAEFRMRSNGYLFYRQLFFFKARISASQERIDDQAFMRIADRAARELVAGIDAFNLGGCANRTIELNPDANPEAVAEVLVARTLEIQNENCIHATDDAELAAKSKGAHVVTIEFSPDDWKAE